MAKKNLKSIKSSSKTVSTDNIQLENNELCFDELPENINVSSSHQCDNEVDDLGNTKQEAVMPSPKISIGNLVKHLQNNGFSDDCIRGLILSMTNMNSPKCNVELMNTKYVEDILMSLSSDDDVSKTNNNADKNVDVKNEDVVSFNQVDVNSEVSNSNSPIDVIKANINVRLEIPYKREGTQCVVCCDDGLAALLGAFCRISSNNKVIGEGVFKTKAEITADSLTIWDGLQKYIESHNIKDGTITAYKNAFYVIFKDLGENWKQMPIESLATNYFTNKTKICYQFARRVEIIFNWCQKMKLISFNPISETMQFLVKQKSKPREALDCQTWRRLSQAKKVLSEFFSICKSKDQDVSIFLLFLFIIGVRVTESLAVICNTSDEAKEKKSVYISTKTSDKGDDPDFCVPLSRLVLFLIEKLKQIKAFQTLLQNKKLKDRQHSSFLVKVRALLRDYFSDFNGGFTLHGTRAIYRTVISLMKYNFSHEAVEKYLDHVVGSTVERVYNRQDYFEERQKIQCVYGYFIAICYGDKNIIAEAKKAIVEYNASVDDPNYIVSIDENWEKQI